MPLDWCSHLKDVEVGTFDAWVSKGLSFHVPLIVDVDVPVAQPAGAAPSREMENYFAVTRPRGQ